MNFVHIADMHFDVPFTSLNERNLGNSRRLDQREVFQKIIEYIKQNEIEYLFICGDLYEHEYVKASTIEFINNQFKQIPNTKIFMVPGNHDPIISNSYYAKYKWNTNVTVFTSEITKLSEKDVDIYGYGFDNFYMRNSKINQIKIDNPNKINILLTHASVDGNSDELREYNPMSMSMLKALDFDYIALGHVHKTNFEENKPIIYPGSTIALGFDELGKHGMVVGNIDENKRLQTAFIPVDKKQFVEVNINMDEILAVEELIEIINKEDWEENNYYKLNLVGKRNFEINPIDILKYINSPNVLKVKDKTVLPYDLEKIAKEESLRGIFVKNLLEKMNEENRDLILKAIEIGLEAM